MWSVALLPSIFPFCWVPEPSWYFGICVSHKDHLYSLRNKSSPWWSYIHWQWLRYGWECEPGQDNEMGEEVYGKDIPVSIKKTTEERALFLPLEIIMSRCYNWNWHKGIKQLPKQRKKAMMKMQSGEMERIWVLNGVVSHELNLLRNLPHLGLTATFPNCWSQCSLARSVTWIQRYYNWCELLLCYFSYLSVRLKWAQ